MSYTQEQIRKLLKEREWDKRHESAKEVQSDNDELKACMNEDPDKFIDACEEAFSSKIDGYWK